MDMNGHTALERNSSANRREVLIRFSLFVDLLEKEIARYNPIQSDSEIIHFLLNTFSDILEDGFVVPDIGESEYEETIHYWPQISEILNSENIKFVNSLEQFITDTEKAYVWILIELSNKTLTNVFEEISSSSAIMYHYYPRSMVKRNAVEIKETLEKLCRIDYTIESKFLKAYHEHNEALAYELQHHGSENDSNPGVLALESPDNRKSSDFIPPRRFETPEHFHSSSLESPSIYPIPSSLENTRTSSLFKSVSSFKGKFEGNTDKGSLELFKTPMEVQKFDEIEETSDINTEETKGDPRDHLLDEYGSIKIHTPKWKHRRRTSSLKQSDQLLNPNLQDSIININNGTPISPVQHTYSPRSDCYTLQGNSGSKDELSNKSGYLIHESPMPMEDEASIHLSGSRKKLVISGFSGVKTEVTSSYETPIFRNGARHLTAAFNYVADEPPVCKNSETLYADRFQKIQYEYEYRERPARKASIEDQNSKCFACGNDLNRRFLLFWSRKGFCHYTGYWYCSDCMASETCMIPWYVDKIWDFTKYSVCKTAYKDLEQLYDKPNIIMEYTNPVLQRNKTVYETIVVRRQVHLMFDMICDKDYVLKVMENHENLVVRQNLFSLEDLVEVDKGSTLIYLEKCYLILSQHVANCEACQSKGRHCEICNSEQKIFHYDIRNTAICGTCKKLYHSKCFLVNKCKYCE